MGRSWLFGWPLLVAGLMASRPAAAQRNAVSLLSPSVPHVGVPLAPIGVPIRPAATPASRATAPPGPAAAGPLLLLNSQVIIGSNCLAKLKPRDIQNVVIYKGVEAPQQWRSLTAHGIIDITAPVRMRLKTESFAQLQRRLRLAGPVSYQVNGLPLASARLRIANEAIKEIKLTQTPSGRVLNVQVVGPSDVPASPRPPGTIMIRGLAARQN